MIQLLLRLLIALVMITGVLMPGSSNAGMTTEVIVNKSVLLNLQQPSDRVSIANPAIAELVVISPTQLQIIGTKIGSTSLIVWERGGKTSFFDIRVKGDLSALENQIREIAPNDSITVDYANDTIVLSGKASNEQTVAKAVQIASAYAAKEENDSGKNGTNSIQFIPMYGYGIPREAEQKDNGPKRKVLNHIQIDNPQQVLLEVKVAQVDKSALKSLGVSLLVKGKSGEGFSNTVGAPDTQIPPLGIRPTPGIAGDIPWMGAISPLATYQLGGSFYKSGLGGVLKALASKNLAKILAEPNMLVKSGQEGKFLSGSKYPVQVVTGIGAVSGTEIKYIDVGVKLNFKPVVMENGLIALKIEPAEVSSIQGFLQSNGYPIIDTREIRSEVQLKDGESLVMAGLLQEESIKAMSKIPILGDIPILGALFRSTEDDIKEKELVFFVTPRLVNPEAPGVEMELPTDEELTPEQEKEFKWMPTGE